MINKLNKEICKRCRNIEGEMWPGWEWSKEADRDWDDHNLGAVACPLNGMIAINREKYGAEFGKKRLNCPYKMEHIILNDN